MLTLTYEYKLQPNRQQIEIIEHTLSVCRSVWNFALRERKDWHNSRKSPVNACSIQQEYIIPADEPYPNYHKQAKALTEAKKTDERLKSVNAQVLQQVLRTIDRAFADMKEKGLGFPRFKNRYRLRSYVYPQLRGKELVKGNQIKLPQLGWVRFRKSRDIPEGFKIKQARVVRKASGYFVMLSLQLDVDVPQPFPHGHPRGLDLGFDKFVATSDGLEVKRPRFLKSLQRKLRSLQRRLKNKQKGSNNRHKLNRKIARVHQRISDTRKDWHFKLAHHLCDGAGMIFVEDINFRTWQRGMLSKHAADAGFGQFVNILQWVCWKRDVYFAKVDKDGTSQECSRCGTETGKKTLEIRIHNCPECGYIGARDVVSGEVIRNRGLSDLGQGLDVKQNACGDDLAGALPSQESVRQESLVARLGISHYSR
ncbi:transposase IS891/IS1136/IS1341 family [Halothece sp. PCC 7418]|uniref:RNA-guided endonuclease InsQ/TnpB family protein n=1 Tax=Halothece sp. (strain PCC 7418) TaxID=65093 RepID=UPI0002A08406|nr:RNA-guided endonuclease TnpB family protein [Halothece sp. PCC 7418]AFZ45351.1 transposase IS891/IS1136/IS1341 family [Halothece sp. PCC 7418]